MTSGRRRPEPDAQRLLAELRVHQAELEQQNVELREARDAAETALANYTDLYEFAPVGYATVDSSASLVAANLALATLLGADRARLLGCSLLLWIAEPDRPAFAGFLKRVRGGETLLGIDVGLKASSGARLSVSVVASLIAGTDSCRVAMTDQTRRGEAERAVQQAQKMDAIGRLAGGIAHDLNNLLTIIGGRLELAISTLPPDAQADLQEMHGAVERATALTTRLLAFARPQALAERRTDMNALLSGFLPIIRRLIPARVQIVTKQSSDAGDALCDPVQLEQVLMNLATNAGDAMPQGGKLTFETSAEPLDAEALAGHAGVGAGRFVRLRVTDTGTGMDAEALAHLFEPFFTTKPIGRGTGLGLATVYAIVRQAGGIVTVASESGRGTTIDVSLPQLAPAGAAEARVTPAPPVGGHETVLIVDDEPGIVSLARRVLRRFGYKCFAAADGAAALQLATEQRERIDLVLSDVVMPSLSGPDFVRRLRAAGSDVPVIFMTGYATLEEIHVADLPAHEGVLHKPFTTRELAAAVRQVLDRGRPSAQ